MMQTEISRNIEDSMAFDFNLMIEEFPFYQMITPKMQTELI
jgi:hypothetical protein